jgi:propionate CoA-transferase
VVVRDGGLAILADGQASKFVHEVEHRTFSGPQATRRGTPVLYITERCVFQLGPDGLELIEVAPGIDIEKDIIGRMSFRPHIPRPPKLMDPRIFVEGFMHLRDDILTEAPRTPS